jgi:hypothetical protein
MGGVSTIARWSWYTALLALVVLFADSLFEPAIAAAQAAYEINPIGTDAGRRVDRYQIKLGPGASLWDVGFNRLPLVAIEQGDQKVVELIEQSFRNAFPDRGPELVKPGDSFVLEVPTGTFVSKTITRQEDRVLFESFAGDRLTTFPDDAVVKYRLQRASDPDHVEVLIQGGQADAVAEAKRVYDVPDPDFVQVRTVRGALAERTSKLTVDVKRRYLDEFRAVRDRATLVEDTPQGLKAYRFSRDDGDIPFVRVDDSVGDLTDPATFTRIFRIAYYRDGTVRKYVITEAGDSTGALGRPESEIWRQTLPAWREWLPGQAEALPPFAPAIASSGALQPGRILVMAFRPRVTPASTRTTGALGQGSGISCAGVPLGLVLLGGALAARTKRSPLTPSPSPSRGEGRKRSSPPRPRQGRGDQGPHGRHDEGVGG